MSTDKKEEQKNHRPPKRVDESIGFGEGQRPNQVYDTLKPPQRPKPKPDPETSK